MKYLISFLMLVTLPTWACEQPGTFNNNVQKVANYIFEQCQLEQADLKYVANSDYSNIQSEMGFLLAFHRLVRKSHDTQSEYQSIRESYDKLIMSYNQALHDVNTDHYSKILGGNYPDMQQMLDIKSDLIPRQKKYIDKLNFMLMTQEDFINYRAAYQKLIPAIITKEQPEMFSNLSSYECIFLSYQLPDRGIAYLQKFYNFSCR